MIGISRLWSFCVFAVLASAPQSAAAQDWTGQWDVAWHSGAGRLILDQQGNRVTGTLQRQGVRIDGSVTGSRLDGRWSEGERSGPVVFVLGRDKSAFAGHDDVQGWWTGHRPSDQIVDPRMDLSTPRDAMATFLAASNMARSGSGEGWGPAVTCVEFPHADTQASAADLRDLVRRYFEVVDLTTFDFWTVPNEDLPGPVSVDLRKSYSDAKLTVTIRRDERGDWHVVIPSEDELAAARKALLAVDAAAMPSSQSYRRLQNPRDTMRAFLEGMDDWNGHGRELAFSTLDLSALPDFLQQSDGALIAQYLRRTLQQVDLIALQSIPNDGKNRDPYVHYVHPSGSIVIAPTGPDTDAPWQFTRTTVDQIPDLYFATVDLPPPTFVLPGRIPQSPYFAIRTYVGAKAPFLLGRIQRLEYWQILTLFVVIPFAFGFGRITAGLLGRLIHSLPGSNPQAPRLFIYSLTVPLTVAIMRLVPGLIGIPQRTREYSLPLVGAVLFLATGVALWHILSLVGQFFTARAEAASGDLDDIVVNFILAGGRLAIVLSTFLGIAYLLSIPTTHIFAGLGIGGLAFAFAAQETLSNMFGAGTLMTDRPFRSGDWIETDFVQGAVEAVGIRSTRIRTAQDSVAVIPNGKLSKATINNMGTRRHRVVQLKLLVTRGGTPARLEAWINAVQDRIGHDSAFLAGRTQVGVVGIEKDGVTIAVSSYLDVRTDRAEFVARHTLLVDLVAIAQTHGMGLSGGIERPEEVQ